jgi:hypothetical protein
MRSSVNGRLTIAKRSLSILNLLMPIPKFSASILVALLLSGGACYELPNTIDSTGIAASEIVPNYWLRQSIDRCEMAFDRPRFNLKSNSNKQINLLPPAKFTFKGKSLPTIKPDDGGDLILPCENGVAEFVVTDDRGSERRDKVDLSKITLQIPATAVDRATDLKIPVVGAAYPQAMDIQTRVEGSSSADNYDDMSIDTAEYQGDRTRITFDKKTQILTIPKQILNRIKTDRPTIRLAVKITMYERYPDNHSSPWLQYEYWTPAATIKLLPAAAN